MTHCLLAPTAGGKTEAASFPILTRAANEGWRGLSVLYVCPLRALLNNLEPRLNTYAEWLGRRAQLWHGDTTQGKRKAILANPPDVLLTTPESLEAMLVSTKVNPREHFANVRAIVVDEVHAFAGDDRGWHLLAVLERLEQLAGTRSSASGCRPRSATRTSCSHWLQGSGADKRPSTVVAPDIVAGSGRPPGDVTLDHVGSIANAAKVISLLHAGEKRLVFCESRREVEELARSLRERDVTTFVSHSSLSIDERRRAEQAFAEARDCVIVSTSTLELGIDVGDLDRVIQINAPRSVASFLQRLGRTGRRPGSTRNALFLTTTDDGLLQAAGLLLLWSRGYVEPVTAPPSPRHIAAQQMLALCLQEGRIGNNVWSEWWDGLPIFDEHADGDRRLAGRVRPPRLRRRDALHRPRGRTQVRPPQLHGPRLRVHGQPGVHSRPGAAGARQGRPHRPDAQGRRPPDHRARRPIMGSDLHRLEAPALLRRAGGHPTRRCAGWETRHH